MSKSLMQGLSLAAASVIIELGLVAPNVAVRQLANGDDLYRLNEEWLGPPCREFFREHENR